MSPEGAAHMRVAILEKLLAAKDAEIEKLRGALEDIHSTTSQIKFSWFKDRPEIVKQAVGDIHQFAELALTPSAQKGEGNE